MNPKLNEILEKLKDFWSGTSATQRLLMGAGAVLLVTALAVVSTLASRDPMKVLYSDLQGDESRAIQKKLADLKIKHQVSEDGQTISVPVSKVDAARMELAKEGMPGQDVVGFEKFDGSTLGMSSYVQRIQYIRAVQGELVRSIERLKSVRRARVHISVPPKKTFLEEEEPAKASVILELSRGQKPNKGEVTGIAHLVASAVEGLSVNQISIVDTRGEFLHRPGEESALDKPSALLEQQRQIEREYERRVEDILVPVIGLGKVRAKVTVELDPSRVNMTEETYDPDRSTVKQTVKNEENTFGSRPNPVGIPGSRSNLPGAEVQNPPIPMANTNSSKETQNTSYAVPRKVTVTSKPSGSIKRLTVAVVVDGSYAKTDGKAPEVFQPRGQEELLRLRDLVANAIGFDEGRRDSLTISSIPFNVPEMEQLVEEAPPSVWGPIQNPYARIGILIGAALLFLLLVVRPILKLVFRREEPEVMDQFPRTVAELEAGVEAKPLLALADATLAVDETEPLEKREEEDLRRRVIEKIQEHPKKGFRIVQDWLEEGVVIEPMKQAS